MKTSSKKPKPQPFNIWYCVKCDNQEPMSVDEVKSHLTEKHGITDLRGNRSMLMHMDCEDCFYWDYKWEIGELELIQKTCGLRKQPWRF